MPKLIPTVQRIKKNIRHNIKERVTLTYSKYFHHTVLPKKNP